MTPFGGGLGPRHGARTRPHVEVTATIVEGAQVRDAERLLADVQRLADIGYWAWDVREDRLEWSDELYRIFGVSPDHFEATYEAYLGLLHPADRDAVREVVEAAFETGDEYSVEHRVVQPSGAIRWVIGRGTVDQVDGQTVRLFGVSVDVTERKRTEQLLRDFLANAAHELRTPVAAMASAVELLVDPSTTAAERDDVLAILSRQVGRMRGLTEDLLDLTTLEASTAPVLLTSLALGPVVDRVLAAADVHDARVSVAADAVVMAGPAELEVLLGHLVTNAVLHGEPPIELSATRVRDHVSIVVEDRGSGVPPALVDSLFAPFTRGSGTQGVGDGTGLGLAIARRLAMMQRGTLEYRPRPGGGTRFELRLGAAP